MPSKVIDEINPAEPWWKKVARIPKLPGLASGPLQHGDVQSWEHPQLGTMVRIGAGSSEPEASWTAYPVNISHTGQPHILEVQYPANIPQSMGISILEPNAAGSVLPVGLDFGVYVPPTAADLEAAIGRHRIVFWPKTRQPVVLITNQRDDVTAVHGKIRVLGPKAVAVAGLNLAGSPTTGLPTAMPAGMLDEGRTLAAFMQRPLIPENFSAGEAFDPWSQRSMDDWLTFYDGATRLVQYLKYAGYNSLVLAVSADGSTIYPTQLLEPTPRYDTGIFFASGQDPQRKDVLELLFRLCDREGLRLIPALQFSAPLPELEAVLRRGGPDSVGVEAVGADGVPWSEKYAQPDGASACYNPLHPLVQQAMIAVVRELLDRYRHHPSFDGLAIGTSAHSFAVFPGPAWPSDPRTLQQFSQEAGVTLPPGNSRLLLESPLIEKWLDWRAYRLRQFHGRLADEVQRAGLDSKLYLSLSPMLDSPDIQQILRPALPPRAKPIEGLVGIGIKPQFYAQNQAASQRIILLNPESVMPDNPLERRAVLQQAHSVQELLGELAASGDIGVLQSINPTSMRLQSFDQKSPFGPASTHAVLSPHLTPAGRSNRRRVVRALADLDTAHIVSGGPLLPLGQEEQLRDIVIAYRRLPAQRFQTVPGKYQPLKIRQLSRERHTYLYLVNDSPWPCACAARIVAPGAVAVEELSGLRQVSQPAGGTWSVSLDSYDFLAVRFSAANVQVADVQVTVPDQVHVQLRRRIQRLVAKAASLDEKRPIEVLENASFETPAAAGNVPGWRLIGDPQAAVRTDGQDKHVGQASLQFRGRGAMASLISDPFTAPDTGRIAFTVWLKASADFQGPLRLAVGGTHGKQEYYRHGVAQPNGNWKLFEFSANDLPLSDMQDLHVRFDMMGAGTVWIDEITVS
ncbi:MAG: family 10 glycosylhydrolase, partial [Planctomycetota bacterium]|nr:family 10 glycosylhydrolase [Planctomycetota bacterium]